MQGQPVTHQEAQKCRQALDAGYRPHQIFPCRLDPCPCVARCSTLTGLAANCYMDATSPHLQPGEIPPKTRNF